MFFLSWEIFAFINLESSFEKANFNFSSEIRIAWIDNFLRKYCLFKSIHSHCLEEDKNVFKKSSNFIHKLKTVKKDLLFKVSCILFWGNFDRNAIKEQTFIFIATKYKYSLSKFMRLMLDWNWAFLALILCTKVL